MTRSFLRIAQVAPLWMQLPPPGYGGAELLVSWLTEELVLRGHSVTLFAPAGAQTAARLMPVCNSPLQDAMRNQLAYQYEPYIISAIASTLKEMSSFDIIHSHVGPLGIPFSDISVIPLIHTVHEGLDSVDQHWLLDRHPQALVAAISDSQVSTLPAQRRNNIRTIYHGLDVSDYAPSISSGGYLLFLGRMGPQKNPVGAIHIAQEAGYPIILVGMPQDANERSYFDAEVVPLLNETTVRHFGNVSQELKIQLLQAADALVFPICWDEHFGLVMIESMACGTPVLAYGRGSVPEVIEPGITGFIGQTEADLVAAVARLNELSRSNVASRARERFSISRMVDDYERYYYDAIHGFR